MRYITNIDNLLDTVDSIEYKISVSKSLLESTVKDLLLYKADEDVIALKEPCTIQTWNKGYSFTVTGFYKRKGDNCVMMKGKYLNKEDYEFLSYIHGYDSIRELSIAINNSFYKSLPYFV